jgi:hypothetical protein
MDSDDVCVLCIVAQLEDWPDLACAYNRLSLGLEDLKSIVEKNAKINTIARITPENLL